MAHAKTGLSKAYEVVFHYFISGLMCSVVHLHTLTKINTITQSRTPKSTDFLLKSSCFVVELSTKLYNITKLIKLNVLLRISKFVIKSS